MPKTAAGPYTIAGRRINKLSLYTAKKKNESM